MDQGNRIFPWICWKLGCGLFHCLNLVLAFVAVLLTGLVIFNSLQKEVPLPDNLAQWTMDRVLPEHLTTSWSGAVFDLRGGLHLKNFKLFGENLESILAADTIQLDFSFFDILVGDPVPIDEVNVTGARIFIPASDSPSGLNEPVMQISQAHLKKSDGELLVEYLNLSARSLRFYISGSAPLEPFLQPRRSGSAVQQTLSLRKLLARIHRLPDTLELDCLIHWTGLDARRHSLDLSLSSPSLTLPMAQVERIQMDARLLIHPETIVVRGLDGEGVLTFLNPKTVPSALVPWPLEPPMPISFNTGGDPLRNGLFTFPGEIRLSLRKPFSDDFPVDVLIAEASMGEDLHAIRWALSGTDLFASGIARKLEALDSDDPDEGRHWSIDLQADLENPVLHAFFPRLPKHRLLENTHAGNLSLHTSLSTRKKHASGILFTDDLFIGQTLFSNLKTKFSISRSDINLTRIHVQRSRSESAEGAYFHHLPSSRFSLNAYGIAFPDTLNSILGGWWSRIFTHIDTTVPLPADVTVWGHWREREHLKSMTAVSGGGVSYRGIPLEAMEVRVRSNQEWAYLEHLSGRAGGGSIGGTLAWLREADPLTGKRPMLMDLRSDAPWTVARGASGVTALDALELEGKPDIHVTGVLWQDKEKSGESELIPDLWIELSHRNARSKIAGWNLTGLSLAGNVSRERIQLERLSGALAGGVFTGEMDIRDWQAPEEREIRVDFDLIDADYRSVLAQAIRDGEDSKLYRMALSSETGGGKIDTSMELLLSPKPRGSRGNGQIVLREANIGQIHLFGGLSRFFSGIGLGFSTLNLNSGNVDWALEDGTLRIPHCLLTGPVLKLNLSGEVDVIENQLQLQADAQFFSGFVSKMLTPVSDNFQFDITGPLESPIWKLRLNPLRWFQNRFPQKPSGGNAP